MKEDIRYKSWTPVAAAILALPLFLGCQAIQHSTMDVDPDETRHMQATYDHSDMRQLGDKVVDELAQSEFIQSLPEPAILVTYDIEPRTQRFIDTKTLAEKIRSKLLGTRKVRFVNSDRRAELLSEQKYQAAEATAESRVAIGKQLGAQYMMTGSLIEMSQTSGREVRLSKKELVYYELTIEITDLQTSEIVLSKQWSFARQASKPIIGW